MTNAAYEFLEQVKGVLNRAATALNAGQYIELLEEVEDEANTRAEARATDKDT